ncbi:MAG: GDSL-type esterase/lipase family protein [Deltaproteobacteria bacterium]|nr:GDSL-type esterase/lipase family protein [Deltaproteobacteria bacterium]
MARGRAKVGGARKWLYAIIPVLGALFCLEIGLRIAGFHYESFFECPTWWGRCADNPIFEADPTLFWRLRAGANRDLNPRSRSTQAISSRGMRDDEIPIEKADGEVRVLALGDSCTFGDGVGNWETYSNVLETLVRSAAPDRPVNVINAGVPGYTSYQVRTYLEQKLLSLEPDVVVVYVGFNDNITSQSGRSDRQLGEENPRDLLVQKLFGRLRTYQLINRYLSKARAELARKHLEAAARDELGDEETVPRVSSEAFQENLCAIEQLGRQRGFNLIVTTLPHVFDKEPERNLDVRAAVARCGIDVVDLWSIMKERQAVGLDLYTSDGGHPNVVGHRIVAQSLFRKFQELGLVPAGDVPPLPTIKETTPDPDEVPAAESKKAEL